MSSTTFFFLDIVKYSISGTIVFFVGFLVLRPYLDQKIKLRLLDIKREGQAAILPLRLQAYERLVLLIERINPANLLLRVNAPGLSLTEFQQSLYAEIRSEFQHNITQQLYVSGSSWTIANRVKDDTILMIGNAAKTLPEGVSPLELSRLLLGHLGSLETNPYDDALSVIREDIQRLF